jgi:hypothetical protein
MQLIFVMVIDFAFYEVWLFKHDLNKLGLQRVKQLLIFLANSDHLQTYTAQARFMFYNCYWKEILMYLFQTSLSLLNINLVQFVQAEIWNPSNIYLNNSPESELEHVVQKDRSSCEWNWRHVELKRPKGAHCSSHNMGFYRKQDSRYTGRQRRVRRKGTLQLTASSLCPHQ